MTRTSFHPGFSDTAVYVASAGREIENALAHSAAFSKQTAWSELAEVWEECKTPNWDGYNAHAVEQDALRNAYIFIESLPLGCPLPSVGAEPDGHLTLEWYRDPRWTLSVSVSPDGMLYYAALFGAGDVRGSEPFFGSSPPIILQLIRRVMARR
jgi:hypothetical protein